mmetsp:Transcript_27698/g.83353  ORF Transcript_27698/g.83353 Transcript_27698/m.83353 type:complete len:110 (-) Transcript_27698:674-1003(-)
MTLRAVTSSATRDCSLFVAVAFDLISSFDESRPPGVLDCPSDAYQEISTMSFVFHACRYVLLVNLTIFDRTRFVPILPFFKFFTEKLDLTGTTWKSLNSFSASVELHQG